MLTGEQQGRRQTQRHMPAIWRIGKPSSLGQGSRAAAPLPGLARQPEKGDGKEWLGNEQDNTCAWPSWTRRTESNLVESSAVANQRPGSTSHHRTQLRGCWGWPPKTGKGCQVVRRTFVGCSRIANAPAPCLFSLGQGGRGSALPTGPRPRQSKEGDEKKWQFNIRATIGAGG